MSSHDNQVISELRSALTTRLVPTPDADEVRARLRRSRVMRSTAAASIIVIGAGLLFASALTDQPVRGTEAASPSGTTQSDIRFDDCTNPKSEFRSLNTEAARSFGTVEAAVRDRLTDPNFELATRNLGPSLAEVLTIDPDGDPVAKYEVTRIGETWSVSGESLC